MGKEDRRTAEKEAEVRLREAVRRVVVFRGSTHDATQAVRAFVDAVAPLPLRDVNEWVAIIRDEEWSASVAVMNRRWRRFRRSPERILSWVDLTSWDGFRRERMIRSITGGVPNSFVFALLLYRLNDWVPEVRVAARDVVPAVARATEPGIVADVLMALLPRLPTWQRSGEGEVETLLSLLCVGSVAQALSSRLMTATSGPTATILTQALRTSALDDHLTDLTDAVQPAVRAQAYATLLRGEARWREGYDWVWIDKSSGQRERVPNIVSRALTVSARAEALVERALDDRSAAVRRIGGDALIERRHELGETAIAMARRLTDDPYPSLAERGRWLLDHPPASDRAP